jgi:solute carrier family 13 (sodium-dependent dicarboxylate transporter), member 2/3/5
LGSWGLMPLALVTATMVAFLTELASNTATTRILMPIFIQFANDNNRHPLLVGLPCALAASMAFMLPIATPTNAVALGSGKIEFTDFIRAGWKMNFIGIALVTLFVCTTGNWMFGLDDPAEGFKKDWLCNRPGSNMTCPSCYVFASCDYCGSANGTQPPGC